MPQVLFCCSNSRGTVLDRRVADVENLFEARKYAANVVRALAATATAHDWRKCRLHVQDERGKDIFVMPFWSTLSKPGLTTRLRDAFNRTWC